MVRVYLDIDIEGLTAVLAHIRRALRHSTARAQNRAHRVTLLQLPRQRPPLASPTSARRDPPLYIIARKEHTNLRNSKTTF